MEEGMGVAMAGVKAAEEMVEAVTAVERAVARGAGETEAVAKVAVRVEGVMAEAAMAEAAMAAEKVVEREGERMAVGTAEEGRAAAKAAAWVVVGRVEVPGR